MRRFAVFQSFHKCLDQTCSIFCTFIGGSITVVAFDQLKLFTSHTIARMYSARRSYWVWVYSMHKRTSLFSIVADLFPQGPAQEPHGETTTNRGRYLRTWPRPHACTHRTNGEAYVANRPTPRDPPTASRRWGTGRPTNRGRRSAPYQCIIAPAHG